MKGGQQLLSFYVALCVAFAGAVGISPLLHVLVEHGGDGHAHSHAVFHSANQFAHEHAHPHPHSHERDNSVSNTRDELTRRLDTRYPQPKLFGVELREVYRAIGGWMAHAFKPLSETPTGDDNAEHSHHSLAQMFLNGTAEGASDVPLLVCVPAVFSQRAQALLVSFIPSEFEAQTASRAPPAHV